MNTCFMLRTYPPRGSFADFKGLHLASTLEPYDNDPFILWCPVCSTSLGTRANVWKRHVMMASHEQHFFDPPQKQLGTSVIDAAKQKAERERLAKEVTDHRIRVAHAVYQSPGLSIAQVETPGLLQDLLQERRERRLLVGSNLAEDTKGPLIASLKEAYISLFAKEGLLIAFDSSPRNDDAAAVVLSCCRPTFEVSERIAAFNLFARPLDGAEWTRFILDTTDSYLLKRNQFLFGNSDRGGANKPLVRQLRSIWPNYVHVWCYCHALSLCGEREDFPVLKEFLTLFGKVFKKSDAARLIFYKCAAESLRKESRIKWWTKYERKEQLLRLYSVLPRIFKLVEEAHICKKTIRPLRQFFDQHLALYSDLPLALAASVDFFAPFKRATTFFESAKFISPYVYAEMKRVSALVGIVLNARSCPPELPNLFALLASAPPSVDKVRRWNYVRTGLTKAAEYYHNLFVACIEVDEEDAIDTTKISFRESVDLFRFARLFDPHEAKRMFDAPNFDLNEWKGIATPLVDIWDELCQDFPKLVSTYTTYVNEEGIELTHDSLLEWYAKNSNTLGAWAQAAQRFVLLRPSSAVVERVFSIWKTAVPQESLSSLQDTQQLRVQLNFDRIHAK